MIKNIKIWYKGMSFDVPVPIATELNIWHGYVAKSSEDLKRISKAVKGNN